MLTEQLTSGRIQQADEEVVRLHVDATTDPASRRAVVRRVDFHTAIEMDGADTEAVMAKRLKSGSGPRAGCSSANIAATWRFVVP